MKECYFSPWFTLASCQWPKLPSSGGKNPQQVFNTFLIFFRGLWVQGNALGNTWSLFTNSVWTIASINLSFLLAKMKLEFVGRIREDRHVHRHSVCDHQEKVLGSYCALLWLSPPVLWGTMSPKLCHTKRCPPSYLCGLSYFPCAPLVSILMSFKA